MSCRAEGVGLDRGRGVIRPPQRIRTAAPDRAPGPNPLQQRRSTESVTAPAPHQSRVQAPDETGLVSDGAFATTPPNCFGVIA